MVLVVGVMLMFNGFSIANVERTHAPQPAPAKVAAPVAAASAKV